MIEKPITLGILGSGQLGRMSALAAARLGIQTHIYAPEQNSPAAHVTNAFTCADYTDEGALKHFAGQVDVISYEFENIPVESVNFLNNITPVHPGVKLLEIAQDRLKEKAFLNDIGIKTAPWASCASAKDIEITMKDWKTDTIILKTSRFGYDGKGQIKHSAKDVYLESWSALKTESAIIEGIIDFNYEISVVVARDSFGKIAAYPPVKNEHTNHILSKTIAPAPMAPALAAHAIEMATDLADKVDLIGVLALEIFVTKDGQLLANEIAPRTHNSGHWTIDACAVSQFENHVRCVCGLPVGDPTPHSHAEMINLIGDDVNDVPRYLAMSNANVHLYGKRETCAGRKMGHVTILK